MKITNLLFIVSLIFTTLSFATTTATKVDILTTYSGKCDPLFCNCLPPNTPRDKGCSSRTPDKQCRANTETDLKISCKNYCGHIVENCN